LGAPIRGFERALLAASAKFPLLNPIKGTILAAKPLESGECQFIRGMLQRRVGGEE
jgi:hypothetical protein